MEQSIRELLLARDITEAKAGAAIRRRAGLSQREAARAAKVSLAAIRAYEQGRRRPSGEAGTRYGRLLEELVARR